MDDRLKTDILVFLNDLNNAKPTIWLTAHGIAARLKQYHRNQVVASVQFLAQEDWLQKKKEKGTELYKIASKGMDRFSPSEYRSRPVSHVTINGSNNIFVMGDNLGTINQSNSNGIKELDKLIALIGKAEIAVDRKRDAVADAEAVKTQLLKSKPNLELMMIAWKSVEVAATLAGAADFAHGIAQMIGLIPG